VASFNRLVDDLKKSFLFLKSHPLLGTTTVPPSTSNDNPSDTLSRVLNSLQHSSVADLAGFITNPRFDDPAYITTLSLVLAAVFITMSWFSRSGNSGGWGGRFSPFGRPGTSPNAGQVSDADFSYITSEDLKKRDIVDWEDKNPNRDTDVLVFKNGKTNYPTHFPAQSIREGELRIGTVRQAAAKKIGVDDPRRIRMFYKGKNLKHDEKSAREEGLRGDGTGSEILCAVGEAAVANMAPGAEESHRAWSDGEEEEDDTESGVDSATNAAAKKRTRKRGGKKNKKKGAPAPTSGHSTPGYSQASPAGAEFLPIPSHVPGPRPTSTPPASRAGAPQTPMGKLDAIASKFHTEFVPLCVGFMTNPPQEKAKRDFEYKKLSETILTQILMKLDGVETDGDQDARMKRKEIVKEVNAMLNKLDEMGK
jgi:hypothetical protein